MTTNKTATEKKPDNRTPEQRFRDLATKRVPRAAKALRLIGNLSAPGYSYTTEQVEKMRSVLQDSLDRAMKRFDKAEKTEETFVL